MAAFIDETGNVYGRLTVIHRGVSVITSGKPQTMWVCVCICGKETTVIGSSLRLGFTQSCGCFSSDKAKQTHTTHGCSPRVGASQTYHIWESMRSRCLCPTDKRYSAYGGSGILVCERWADFSNFLEDMGEKPEGMTLDRIDGTLGYTKENCRWATTMEQVCNRSVSIWVVRDGVRKVLKHWCLELNVSYSRALREIKKGLTPEDTLISLVGFRDRSDL